MNTPIYDFIKEYADSSPARFHMPGHKGRGPLGIEKYDLTEIIGADDLFSPITIIAESERNAASLFGTAYTLYSTEGSTLAIKTMLALATRKKGSRILAARSAHKAFIHAAALLDFDFEWIYPDASGHLCDGRVSAEAIDRALTEGDFTAVYITSPDYLGNIADVAGISRVCKKHGAMLLVDNAHGAYLAFLEESMHPIALGANMCCDSAHKTLPVLTGGAYLHLANADEREYLEAKRMMSVFASSSPSYLILASLDLANKRLSEGFREELSDTVQLVAREKHVLTSEGYSVLPSEPLKITLPAASYGMSGDALTFYLRARGIHVEFYDDELLVLMVSPDNTESELRALSFELLQLTPTEVRNNERVSLPRAKRIMSPRAAMLAEHETVEVTESAGRICASAAVSCPPAIPIVSLGEEIPDEAIRLFEKYDIREIEVVKND